jgi:RNA polymerase sigma-70 factor (ECF subfamily)
MTTQTGGVAVDVVEVWRQFRDRLVGYVERRVGNPQDAEDIVQEVMLRIHRHRDQLGDVQHVGAWVYRITGNAITDHYRGTARRARAIAELAATGEPGGLASDTGRAGMPDPAWRHGRDGGARAELAACLSPILDQLAEAYRQALVLTELHGLTQVEAAARAGLSVSGMKSRVQRARKQLKDQLLLCCDVHLDARGDITGYAPHPAAACTGCTPRPAP